MVGMLSKFKSSLAHQWTKNIGDVNSTGSNIPKITTDINNNIFISFATANKIRFSSLSSDGTLLFGKEITLADYTTCDGLSVNNIEFNQTLNKISIVGNVYKSSQYSKGYSLILSSNGTSGTAVFSDGPFLSPFESESFLSSKWIGNSLILFGETNCQSIGENDLEIVKLNSSFASCCTNPGGITFLNYSSANSTLDLTTTNLSINRTNYPLPLAPSYLVIQSSCRRKKEHTNKSEAPKQR